MNPLETAFKKAVPAELLSIMEAAGQWFNESGYVEALENDGTTGLCTIITKVNGKPAAVTFALSYLTEEQLNIINRTATQAALNKTGEEA